MAGLIPVGGGGDDGRLTCFRCGEPAAGPCAFCRVSICADDACASVVREPGLAPVVLCADCAQRRPVLAGRAWAAPLLALVGAALLGLMALAGAAGVYVTLGSVAAVSTMLFAAAVAVTRWQWRSRLARARGGPRRDSS
jgi:hypothetical protein